MFFTFKEFVRAFEIMAIPPGEKLTSKDVYEAKVKFFSKLQKLIERYNSKSTANGPNKDKSPYIDTSISASSSKGMVGSNPAARI